MNLEMRTQRSIGLLTGTIKFSVANLMSDLGLRRSGEQASSSPAVSRDSWHLLGTMVIELTLKQASSRSLIDLFVPVHWSWGNN